MEEFDPVKEDAIAPEEEEITLSDEAYEFLIESSGKLNYLVDNAGMAAYLQNNEYHAQVLAALVAFGFNKGIEFSKEK